MELLPLQGRTRRNSWYYSGMTFRGSAFRFDGPVLESVAFNVDKQLNSKAKQKREEQEKRKPSGKLHIHPLSEALEFS